MTSIDRRVIWTTRKITEWLVRCDYDAIERYSAGVRLNAVEIADAIREYGRKLTMPTSDEFENLDVIEVENSFPMRWSVRCYLWTEEEGRSDLSIELTLIDNDRNDLAAEIDNLHVL